MDRKDFLKNTLLLSALPLLTKAESIVCVKKRNQIQLLRHATIVVQLGKIKFLVDPMLSLKGAMDPVQGVPNTSRVPMIDLPISSNKLKALVDEVDAILVTHTHDDHWDEAAMKLIDKKKPLFCQPPDKDKIQSQGFVNVIAIEEKATFSSVTIYRTGGKHGAGKLEKYLGPVSGFVLDNAKEVIYIAGDTIWCDEIKNALVKYQPKVTILNAGSAQLASGDPISMTPEDIQRVYETLPHTRIAAVHMDTLNHCRVSRSDLRNILVEKQLDTKVLVPADGEVFYLS